MPLPSLPVESWQGILQECISLPTFFDADCLPEVTDPLHDSKYDRRYDWGYWESERHRNALRRVCKSWDAYLHQFKHRFVKLEDVYHKRVPIEALRTAIRICYTNCDISPCSYCQKGDIQRDLLSLIKAAGESSTEIIDCRRDDGKKIANLLITAGANVPHLRAILNVDVNNETIEEWEKSISSLRQLKFLDFGGSITQWKGFNAENITTLSYFGYLELDLQQCSLPSLNHLRIIGYRKSLEKEEIASILRLLQSIGQNLLSLQLGKHDPLRAIMPREIWRLCPRLERLDCGLNLDHPPPPNHPLHTVSIFFPYTAYNENYTGITHLIPLPVSQLRHYPSLRRVVVWDKWERAKAYLKDRTISRWTRDFFDKCTEFGITFEDSAGVSFGKSGIDRLLPPKAVKIR